MTDKASFEDGDSTQILFTFPTPTRIFYFFIYWCRLKKEKKKYSRFQKYIQVLQPFQIKSVAKAI